VLLHLDTGRRFRPTALLPHPLPSPPPLLLLLLLLLELAATG